MRKLFSTMLLSLLLGPAAWAQTPHIWNLGIYDPTIDSKHALGTLQVHGRIFPAGTSLSALSPDPAVAVPGYIEAALRAHGQAWLNFTNFAPSYRRLYVRWIEAAKREETRRRRLAEAVTLLASNEKLGMK